MSLKAIEIAAIASYLLTHSVAETAHHFNHHRHTIEKICREWHIAPPKSKPGRHKEWGYTLAELKSNWSKQDLCEHKHYVTRCTICNKVLGSETSKHPPKEV